MHSLVRALIRCYPPAFRARYAREVDESTRALLQRAWRRGLLPGLRVTLSVMADLLRSIVTERRLAHLRGDAGPRGPFRAGGAGHDIRDAFRQLRR
ncbi:MAG TPA: hypothetical protein VMN78_11530, partial [Longimicrobiales bacterium]|nr:hypothetical protein [Longimicrobiales bacterium]